MNEEVMKGEESLISVIVPVYNVKDYVGKCLDSICSQTYKNIEIIVVDDGSTDGSGVICDMYAAKDRRIKVMHCDNGGLSTARNRGIAVARGEYIAFVDSDDWLEKVMYQSLYEGIKQHDADVSVCSFYYDYPDRSRAKCNSNKAYLWTGREALHQLLSGKRLKPMVWDKLYKRSLFDEIKFPDGRIFEDAATTYKIFAKAKKVFFFERPYYHYICNRPGSIMSQKFYNGEKNLLMFDTVKERSHFLYHYDRHLWRKSLNTMAHKGIQLVERSFLDSANTDAEKTICDYVCFELSKMDRSHLRPDLRIKTYLVVNHLPLYKKLYLGFRTIFKSKTNFKQNGS